MATREKQIVQSIQGLLKQRGAWSVKTCPPVRNGVPDLLVCYHGAFVALECKTEVGKTSVIQDHEIRCIKGAGGQAVVVRCIEDVELVLAEMDAIHAQR